MKILQKNTISMGRCKRIALELTCIVLMICSISFTSMKVFASEDDADKKIEILISSDVGATVSTDKYKEELTSELVSKGFKKENIRLIDSVDTIKTSNIDMGWLVYDHLNYIEPYGSYTATPYTDVTAQSTAACYNRYRHIYSLNGGKEMTFLGYSAPGYKDFAVYPSSSTDTKIVNFDISADKVDTHTLEGAGYLVNAGVDSKGILNAYLLFYQFATPTTGNVYLMKVTQDAQNMHDAAGGTMVGQYGVQVGTQQPFTIDSITKKINVNMIVSPSNIQCSYSKYTQDASGTLVKGTGTNLFNKTIATTDQTGFNGFGPLVSYTSHGCSSLSMFTFSNLSMAVNTSADNALKQTTWSNDSTVAKFYVNITDKGLDINGNKEKIITSIIDNSVYYIGAGTSTSSAKTDADYIGVITNGSKFIETTPGTEDANAITNIAKEIIARSNQTQVTPLPVKDIVIDDKKTPIKTDDIYTVVIDNPKVEVAPFYYEIVYEDNSNVVQKIPANGMLNSSGQIEVVIPNDIITGAKWFVLRKLPDPADIKPTPSKLIDTSDKISPVISFQIVDQSNKENTSYDIKDGDVSLSIKDSSYSNSLADFGTNVTTTYTITAPDGKVVGSNGSVSLTSANAITGDYSFSTKLSVTESSIVTKYELIKKISIFNDSTKPIVKIVDGPSKATLTTPKTSTITMQDNESGLSSYAIIVSNDSTCPDATALLKTVSDSNSIYCEVPLNLPIDKAGTFNIFAVVKDKSGNTYTGLIDSYTVSALFVTLNGINKATDIATIQTIINENASLLNLDLTKYNALKDKDPVLESLKSKNFININNVISTFNNSVMTEKSKEDMDAVKEEINAGILKVQKDLAEKTIDTVTSADKAILDADKTLITSLLSRTIYLMTSQQITTLQERSNFIDSSLNRINQNAEKVKTITESVAGINADYTTVKKEDELTGILAQITDVLKKEGNITAEEKAKLITEKDAIEKAIVLKEEINVGILKVQKDLAEKTIDTVTSADKTILDADKELIASLLTRASYLTNQQITTLQERHNFIESSLDRINQNAEKVKTITESAAGINADYTTVKKEDELTGILAQITDVLKHEGNITDEEKAKLVIEKDAIEKAIVVIEDRTATKDEQKDPFVILAEDKIKQLPNPDTSTESAILESAGKIADAKTDFDKLGEKQALIEDTLTVKLDKLIKLMAKINVSVDAQGANTEVTASGLGLLISESELNSGDDIAITLKVEKKSQTSADETLFIAAADDHSLGAYFDISLYKTIGMNEPTKLTDLNTKIKITIEIPENIRGKSGYAILRNHNGVVETLETTKEGDILTFETDRFSTYVISFDKDKIVPSPVIENKNDLGPVTGDSNISGIVQNSIIFILSAMVMLALIYSKRKKYVEE